MSETKEFLLKELARLQKRRKEITDVSYPLREQRADVLNKARARAEKMAEEFKYAEKGLYELDKDIGLIAKALGGRALSDVSK